MGDGLFVFVLPSDKGLILETSALLSLLYVWSVYTSAYCRDVLWQKVRLGEPGVMDVPQAAIAGSSKFVNMI